MLTILKNQAEAYRLKLVNVETKQKERYEEEVAPVLAAQSTQISDLRREMELLRKSKEQAVLRAASKSAAEAKAAKKKYEEMCEVSMKQRFQISELETKCATLTIEMRRLQEISNQSEKRAEETERLLQNRGKRCEQLHKAHATIKDQIHKIEGLRSPSPISSRTLLSAPPPSPAPFDPTGSAAVDCTPRKAPASVAKLRQLAQEGSTDTLRKMIICQTLVERYRLHKRVQVREQMSEDGRVMLSLQVELGQLAKVLRQSQVAVEELEEDLREQKWMHQDYKQSSTTEINTLRRLAETYRGEHVRTPCKVIHQPPSAAKSRQPISSQRSPSSLRKSSSRASSRLAKSEKSDEWTSALDELGGAFQFA